MYNFAPGQASLSAAGPDRQQRFLHLLRQFADVRLVEVQLGGVAAGHDIDREILDIDDLRPAQVAGDHDML